MHTAPEMNGRDRRPAAANGGKAAAKGDNRVMETDPRKAALPVRGSANAAATTRGVTNRIQSRRERKLALQQDVDKLKKKLLHEENVHRALERAFTRPLGALPRLPPYLPSQTLALLAEVAVLEEEVVRLEEQVVNFRQGLYQEATITSSAKNACLACGEGPVPSHQPTPSIPMPNWEVSPSVRQGSSDNYPPARPSLNNGVAGGKQTPRKPVPSSPGQAQDDRSGAGKENQSCSNTSSSLTTQSKPKSGAPAPDKRRATPAQTTNATPDRKRPAEPAGNNSDKVTSQDDSSVANKLSEELLRCLLTIFSRLGSSAAGCQTDEEQHAPSPSVSGSNSSGSSEDAYPQDPYGVLELGARGMGPYKRFHVVDVASFDRNALAGDTLLSRRLKALLRRLSSVDLPGLSHQQKRAFWINIYDVCVMNAFLEQGIPTTPHTLVAMMPKAARLPYSVKQVDPEATKGDDVTARWGWSGLSPWSPSPCPAGAGPSPAVRVYTAARVEEELEVLL